jgi:hypothetical protein
VAYTDAGLRWIWQQALGVLRNEEGALADELSKARLVVGDGSRTFAAGDTRLAGGATAYAEMDEGFPKVEIVDGVARLTLRGTFDEESANFEWQERGVTSVRGVLIDRTVSYQGTKAPGTRWTAEVVLELARDGAA